MTTQTEFVTQGSARRTVADTDVDAGADDRTPPEEAASLPLDVVFDLLSNERRRRVLRYLRDESGSTTLGDLAEHIASIENDKPEDALSSAERKRVYICLYQCHLPRMDDAGVVDFDENRKTVDAGERLAQVTDYLPGEEGEPAEARGAPTRALSVAAAVGGLFVAQRLVVPNGWLSGVLIGLLLVSAWTLARSSGFPERDVPLPVGTTGRASD